MANRLTQSWAYSTAIVDLVTAGELNSAPFATVQTGGPFGDNYLSFAPSNGDASILQNWPLAVTTFYWGNRVLLGLSAGIPGMLNEIYFVSPNSQYQFFLQFNGLTRTISAYVGNPYGGSPTLVGTSAVNAYPLYTFFFLEVGATIASGSGGSITVKVGAGPGSQTVVVLNATGINTQGDTSGISPGNAQVSVLGWRATGSGTWSISHEYMNDSTGASPNNSFLGDVRVVALEPVSNDSVAFAPVGQANNWQNAALVPPVPGSDYNYDSTLNAQDTYVVAALPADLGTVFVVTAVASMFYTGTGGRSMATVVKSGTTAQVNGNVALSGSPLVSRTPVPLDPATAAQWAVANMTAGKLKVGVKVTV